MNKELTENIKKLKRKIETVYIASPYSSDSYAEREINVYKSFEMANKLIDNGFYPYCPLYTHYLHELKPRNYEVWMAFDFKWLEKCNCVLRLPGESSGSDREIEHAKKLGIPVFYSLDSLLEYVVK